MWSLRSFLLAAALANKTFACIQAHMHWLQNSIYVADHADIQVWVNGQLVCSGSDDNWEETSGGADPLETKFCLQNGDGKGSGCAPGYSYCMSPREPGGTFYYWGEKGDHHCHLEMLNGSCRKRPASLSCRLDSEGHQESLATTNLSH